MLHNQSCVCGCIVVMELPVVRAPFAWPLPPQDVAVELRIDSLTWRHEFLMDNPVNIEKADQH
jgi:hypothetical protein